MTDVPNRLLKTILHCIKSWLHSTNHSVLFVSCLIQLCSVVLISDFFRSAAGSVMIREAIKDTILSIPEETDKEGAEEAPIPKDTIVRDV